MSVTRFVRKLGEVTDAEIDETAAAIALCVGVPGELRMVFPESHLLEPQLRF